MNGIFQSHRIGDNNNNKKKPTYQKPTGPIYNTLLSPFVLPNHIPPINFKLFYAQTHVPRVPLRLADNLFETRANLIIDDCESEREWISACG